MASQTAIDQPAHAESAPSSLDHGKPSVEKPSPEAQEQAFRFRHYAKTRHDLASVVESSTLTANQKIRFQKCGTNAWLQRSPSTGRLRLTSETCKLRFCPACRLAAARHAAKWIEQALTADKRRHWRFVTLTLRHSHKPLTEQMAHLRKSFRRLRQRRWWRNHVAGGFAVIEVKVSDADALWHPHLHVLCHGSFLDQRLLSKQWLLATRDSMIVDVRAVKDAAYAASYVSKYINKPPPTCVMQTVEYFNEWLDATRYAKLIIKFGSVPPYEPPQNEPDYPADWQPLCSLVTCIARANAGDHLARSWLNAVMEAPDEPADPDLFAQPPALLPALHETPDG